MHDSGDNRVFVDSWGNYVNSTITGHNGTVSIIDPTTNAMVGTIFGFTTPWSMLYLAAKGTRSAELFVSEPAANDVAILNPSTGSIITRNPGILARIQPGSGAYTKC